jgi:hypothetical protein
VYVIKAGKNMVNVKVIDFDQASQSWICETESGKQLSIKDSERFLNEICSEPAAIPVLEPKRESPRNLKEVFAKANAVKIVAKFCFCSQELAESFAQDAAGLN